MARGLTAACLIAILAVAVAADEVYLIDGRILTGTVTIETDGVLVEMDFGSVRVPHEQILKIERRAVPQEQLLEKLETSPAHDADSLFEIAQWAAEQQLEPQASELCQQVLKLDPDHTGARHFLGQFKFDERWLTIEQGLELGRSMLEAGDYEQILKEILPALGLTAGRQTQAQGLAAKELLGQTQLRAGQFSDARKTFSELAGGARGPAAIRYEAIATILLENADGMYVLSEPYPPTAGLLRPEGETLPPGPASLADPLVLAAALQAKAKQHVETGKEMLAARRSLDETDSPAARAKVAQASKAFDRADALVPNITRSYRLEMVRRRIAAIRKNSDEAARKFDQGLAKLGSRDISARDYRALVARLIQYLDPVGQDLEQILEISKPYGQDLLLEIKWAEWDLQKIEAMRQELAAELHAK